MAETSKIVIEILGENGSGGDSDEKKKKDEDKFDDVSEIISGILHPFATINKEITDNFPKSKFAFMFFDQAKSIVTSAFNAEVNRFFTLTENYVAERSYNGIKQTINTATGFLGAMGAGAIAGAKAGGGYGAIIGAVLSGGGYIANSFINSAATMSSYQQSLNATVAQTNFSASRASLINNSEGTEN